MSVQVSDRGRPFVLAAIMLSTFMISIEQTIVATAMPSIVSQLGGFNHYSWVFSAFLVPQTTTTVIWGKLADMYGRKPILVLGLAIFLLGSLLCGMAGSMNGLIGFRVLQGIGAGAIQPVTMTLVGDLYRMEQRAKIQAFVSGTWVVASVVGPLTGGLVVKFLPWAWVFWVNLPLGVITIAAFLLTLKEAREQKDGRIDYPGALLFAVSIVALLFLISEPDQPAATLATCAALFLCGGTLFIWWEMRAPEPIISIGLWARRLIATCNGLTVLIGMILFGLNVMMPIYMQGVLGCTPVEAGLALMALVAGWPIAVILVRVLYPAFGLANVLRGGAVTILAGCCGLIFLSPTSSSLTATFYTLVVSLGLGWAGFTGILMTQESVPWSMRARATSANIFSRSLGAAIGTSALGTVLNLGLAHFASAEDTGRIHAMLNHDSGLAAVASSPLQNVLYQSVHLTFLAMLLFSVALVLIAWLVPTKEVIFRGASAASRDTAGREASSQASTTGES